MLYMYKITDYSRKQADKLGVSIKPSTNKNKKIDVFRDEKKVASVGDSRYLDYPWYVEARGLEYANKRRMAYKLRHNKDRKVVGSPGYFADRLLW